MGALCSTFSCSSESDQTSCSSVFASCKNDHCASRCSRAVADVAPAVVALEDMAGTMLKKYIEDHLHTFLAEHVPNIVAAQLDAVAAATLDSITSATPDPPLPSLNPIEQDH